MSTEKRYREYNISMTIREEMECLERTYMSPYATLSENSRGRDREEPECDIRPVFQRDRDRILHCKSFRRLKHKTQVFLSPQGDHYRTRLTHALEVSQNARTIAKALRLNESLVEAIALGHDLGHTPFGPTWEVRDGILNHQTSMMPSTLEGKIVRLSDKIAYINHDIDDAIRAHVLLEDDIPEEYRKILGFDTRERLNTLIHDIIDHSRNRNDIYMSPEVAGAMQGLRQFMFQNVYTNPIAKGEETKAKELLERLFVYYLKHIDVLPGYYLQMLEEGEENDRVVCDYIAGMTDQYAVAKYNEYFMPKSWQVY